MSVCLYSTPRHPLIHTSVVVDVYIFLKKRYYNLTYIIEGARVSIVFLLDMFYNTPHSLLYVCVACIQYSICSVKNLYTKTTNYKFWRIIYVTFWFSQVDLVVLMHCFSTQISRYKNCDLYIVLCVLIFWSLKNVSYGMVHGHTVHTSY